MQFKCDEFLRALIEDNAALLCAILKSILGSWLQVINFLDLSTVDHQDIDFQDDNWFLWNLMEGYQLRQQNLQMLKRTLRIIRCQGCVSLRTVVGSKAEEAMKDLLIDFEDVTKRAEYLLSTVEKRITTMAALRSIHESEKAIRQSDRIG
ncbi:Uncharacterized protein LW94_13519 [Fusarium fujikuroi]|nr:Uncharacterized protein LW94_13519 [Fusarium fujikuroi]